MPGVEVNSKGPEKSGPYFVQSTTTGLNSHWGRLIRPDGQTAAEASFMMVPIDDPGTFRVIDKDTLPVFHRLLP